MAGWLVGWYRVARLPRVAAGILEGREMRRRDL
jgi:hypothetical protein